MLSNELIKFANGNTDFYEAAVDWYFNPTAEKGTLLNKAYFAEIENKSGVSRNGISTEAWVSHPSVQWVR